MKKDFLKWHKLKKNIENNCLGKLFNEREIWWCSIGENIGFEQDGKNSNFERPVLVLRKFNSEMYWGLPMTSKNKKGRFYFTFNLKNKKTTAILSQLRIFSSKRLIRRMAKINEKTFDLIENSVIELLKENKNGSRLRDPRVPNGNL